uniref:Protein peanut-like n=1 Tax=Diabrotica virgifera virgifera TaxID=50390 RepID=A0A6P7FQS8_DIAVI
MRNFKIQNWEILENSLFTFVQEILIDVAAELTRRHEATKEALEIQAKELEEKRRQFETEKETWKKERQVTLEELRRLSLEGKKVEGETVDGKKEKKKKRFFNS